MLLFKIMDFLIPYSTSLNRICLIENNMLNITVPQGSNLGPLLFLKWFSRFLQTNCYFPISENQSDYCSKFFNIFQMLYRHVHWEGPEIVFHPVNVKLIKSSDSFKDWGFYSMQNVLSYFILNNNCRQASETGTVRILFFSLVSINAFHQISLILSFLFEVSIIPYYWLLVS